MYRENIHFMPVKVLLLILNCKFIFLVVKIFSGCPTCRQKTMYFPYPPILVREHPVSINIPKKYSCLYTSGRWMSVAGLFDTTESRKQSKTLIHGCHCPRIRSLQPTKKSFCHLHLLRLYARPSLLADRQVIFRRHPFPRRGSSS